MKARSLKNTSAHLATRCVLSALAVVAVISISNVESAHAFNLGGSFFRPSMPRITPRITMPRISVGSGSVAGAANAAGYSHGPKPSSYGAAAGGAGSGVDGAVYGGGKWGHNKWRRVDHTPEQVVERVPKCGTRYHKDHLERGCDIPPPKHVVVNGGNPSNVGPSNTGPSNPGPSLAGPVRPARSGAPPADERRYVPNEVVAEMVGDPTDQTFRIIETRHRLNRIDTQRIGLTNSTFVRWRIADRRSVPAVIRAMEADNTVRNTGLTTQPNYLFEMQQGAAAEADKAEAVEPLQIVTPPSEAAPAAQTVTPPSETPPAEQAGDSAQYALAKLHLPEAQALARGNSVVVAVIDTEIDVSHPELAGAITDSYDALGVAGPKESHGTGIAGTIAAHAKLLGAAPNVRILAIRAFGSGIGTTFTIIKGLDYAVAHDARVINMSFAGPSDPALARALAAAHGRGRILVAAVGNKGPKSPALFPAADPNVIAVTATDAKDRLFEGANRGDHVAIAAPGVDILVAAPGSTYSMSTGTSFASAYVAGVAALLAERKPDITPDGAKNALMSTAHHLGTAKGRDPQFGAGLMDANQAILSLDGRPAAELARGAGH